MLYFPFTVHNIIANTGPILDLRCSICEHPTGVTSSIPLSQTIDIAAKNSAEKVVAKFHKVVDRPKTSDEKFMNTLKALLTMHHCDRPIR